mgnify:CR=1 FL=1
MIEQWSNWVWGNGLLVLLLGTGGYLTIRTRFFPIRCVRSIFRSTVGSLLRQPKQTQRSAGTMTQFQTCSTALAAAMGTGNIIGVAAALQIGGAGAVFWMWVSALLGMLLTYGENVLAMQYCRLDARGERIGGPMAYLAYGLRAKPLAVVYAVFCIAASLGMGNMTQSNAIAGACLQAAGVPVWVTGLAVAGILTVVIFGGAKRIGYVTQWLMPVLSLGYMLAALLVICKNGAALPGALREIVLGAFGMRAVGGGISGAAIRRCMIIGLQRGVFSNEAGFGTGSIAHACADTNNAVHQGMFGIFEVFMDTIVICTLTGLVILLGAPNIVYGQAAGAELTISGFTATYGGWVSIFTAVAMCCFAFSTIIGWGLYGSRCIEFLGGEKLVRPFLVAYSFVSIIGATINLGLLWDIADTFNGLMAIPNLIALLILSGQVKKLAIDVDQAEKSGTL